jgi:ParB family chromosome partitioning protein
MAAPTKRKALGKGLGALIPQKSAAEPASAAAAAQPDAAGFRVALKDIHANPDQPRTHFDPARIDELTASIKEQGILQPLLVRRRPQGGYELIAGERRFRASKKAGLKDVPVIVRAANDKEMLELALVENLQRDDLNPIELALGYQALIEDHRYTQDQLAKRIGRDRSSVANAMRLLKLPKKVQDDLVAGRLSSGHAKAMLSLEDMELMLELRERIVKGSLSVREAEKLAKEFAAGGSFRRQGKKATKARAAVDPDVDALTGRLERRLGVKIRIAHNKKGAGKLTISYANLGELQPVLDKLES